MYQRVLPNSSGAERALYSSYRFRLPQNIAYPQFRAMCSPQQWEKLPIGEWRVLAMNGRKNTGLSMEDINHYRNHFRRCANRVGLFAGLHYNTCVSGGCLYLVRLDAVRGYPTIIDKQEVLEAAYEDFVVKKAVQHARKSVVFPTAQYQDSPHAGA